MEHKISIDAFQVSPVNICPCVNHGLVCHGITPASHPNYLAEHRLYRVEIKLSRQINKHRLTPWGLSLSLVHGRYLVVARVDAQHHFCKLNNGKKLNNNSLITGDCILQINGFDCAFGNDKPFVSFQSMTNYLAQASYLSIVVLRNYAALQHACTCLVYHRKAINVATLASTKQLLSSIQSIRNHLMICNMIFPFHRSKYILYSDSFPIKLPFEVSSETIKAVTILYSRACQEKNMMKFTQFNATTHVHTQTQRSSEEDSFRYVNPITGVEFVDNMLEETDPDDGLRHAMFLPKVKRIYDWLYRRKSKWRSKRRFRVNPSRSTDRRAYPPIPYTFNFALTWNMFPEDLRRLQNDKFGKDFCDNLDDQSLIEGNLTNYVMRMESFPNWLKKRKESWKVNRISNDMKQDDAYFFVFNADFRVLTNELFKQHYSDNLDDFSWEDGIADQFLPKITSFPKWLNHRKAKWKKNRSIIYFEESFKCSQHLSEFWLDQGFSTFEDWLSDVQINWRRSYSWQRKKRKQIEMDIFGEVHFPFDCESENAESEMIRWLVVRKRQWLVARRKRQRRFLVQGQLDERTYIKKQGIGKDNVHNMVDDMSLFAPTSPRSVLFKRQSNMLSSDPEIQHIDALLDEEERREEELKKRLSEVPPFDLTFIFDPALCPDDIIALIFRYLPCSEHGKMMCISSKSSNLIKKRSDMWHSLCPDHWILPKRPRKSWAQLYIGKLREEEEAIRKMSDDILVRASNIIAKRDDLQRIDKIVSQAEKRFKRFSIDYSSAVVLERSSLLNLAIMNSRHKIVRWLIETKGADIETSDRGGFTPLLNAAYLGDRAMVRYLLSKGCNRAKIGTEHSTQALAPIGFKGLDAEGWARERGFERIADMIKYGI